MQRPIKFRAWYLQTNEMINWENIKDCVRNIDWDNFMSDCELMQYTGLKDKNGKEIYEGDWIETPAGIGDVVWDKCYYIRWNPNDMTTLHDCQQDHLEVIGNIYETKEL